MMLTVASRVDRQNTADDTPGDRKMVLFKSVDGDGYRLERHLLTDTECMNEGKMPCQLWYAKRVPAWRRGIILEASPVA